MANVFYTEEQSSVMLFDVRLTEGELQTYALALRHVLETLTEEQLHAVFDESNLESPAKTSEWVEDRYKELMNIIKRYCRDEFLPERFRAWTIESEE